MLDSCRVHISYQILLVLVGQKAPPLPTSIHPAKGQHVLGAFNPSFIMTTSGDSKWMHLVIHWVFLERVCEPFSTYYKHNDLMFVRPSLYG